MPKRRMIHIRRLMQNLNSNAAQPLGARAVSVVNFATFTRGDGFSPLEPLEIAFRNYTGDIAAPDLP